MTKPYTLLDHTADLRIRVTGTDPADLFANAGMALFDLIAEAKQPAPSPEEIDLDIAGEDRADLLVNYLRELLYLWTGNGKLVTMIHILHVSDTAVSARVTTDRYEPRRHTILHEIKAVTYHRIDVSRTPDGWQATVLFDI